MAHCETIRPQPITSSIATIKQRFTLTVITRIANQTHSTTITRPDKDINDTLVKFIIDKLGKANPIHEHDLLLRLIPNLGLNKPLSGCKVAHFTNYDEWVVLLLAWEPLSHPKAIECTVLNRH